MSTKNGVAKVPIGSWKQLSKSAHFAVASEFLSISVVLPGFVWT